MKEIWKDVKGFEGMYSVSNLGQVRSEPRISHFTMFRQGKPHHESWSRKEKLLKRVYPGSTPVVRLHDKQSKRHNYAVKYLVVQAFSFRLH